jgi:hypothetical protein
MDTPSISSARRMDGYRAYGRAADAFEAVAWKAPASRRFQNTIANDGATPEPTFRDVMSAMPGWIVIAGGGVVAALMGAMLGGMLQV